MKTIALVMAYNEQDLIYRCLQNIYDVVDQIILFHGTVSPFGDQAEVSTDNTSGQIGKFLQDVSFKRGNKVLHWSPRKNTSIKTREEYEGWVKNEMLKMSCIEHGDLIYMVDVDEFIFPDNICRIIERFKRDDKILHVPIGEYQFAYNMRLEFKASHNGRFMRYHKDAKYGGSQHYIYPDGKDISKDQTYFMPREESQMFHLCWVKSPELIKQKVLTFRRLSFVAWYNACYLVWPRDPQAAYQNNISISRAYGWPGGGFCEGQKEPLVEFTGKLPEVLNGYNPDYLEYIKENYERLKI